jgi:hypothetical protein
MYIKLTSEEGVYLKDQLDTWIEGYKDIEGEIPSDVVLELLHNREMAERIRERVWRKIRK